MKKIDELRSMKLHGQFGRDTNDKKSEKLWHWVRNGSLKRETESLLSEAQEQTLSTKSVKKSIIRMSQINIDYVEHISKMFCT